MYTRSPTSRRRAAFSLLELLVLIGIIAVLIGLLLPTLIRVRDQAKQLQCASNLRQIGQAMMNYAVHHAGSYPTRSGWQVYGGDGTGEDEPGLGWCEKLESYIGKSATRIYWCPAFPPETEINNFLSAKWVAVNEVPSLKVSDVKRASEFILAGESTHARLYPPPWGTAKRYIFTNDCDKDDVVWKCLSFFGEPDGLNAHRAGNNVLFADGHVTAVQRFEPAIMTYHPHRLGVDWQGVMQE
jgi:prepilin-type processing-associated H-X9-DG protein